MTIRRMNVKLSRTLLATVLVGLLALLLAANVRAEAPAAGTSIGNQATATYTDGSGTTRSVTSNVVSTLILQVAGLTLTQDNTRYSSAGGVAYFPHTLTNTGNSADSFNLTLFQGAGDDFDLSGIKIYPDANGDGLPDAGAAPITSTGSVPAGGTFQFVIVGTVPGTATAGEQAQVDITAISAFDNSQTATNTDTAIVTAGAVVPVTKSVSSPSGAPGSGPYTYTLSYTNSGNDAATNLTLTDLLPAGITYVAGSGRWSGSGATALDDAAGGDPAGINYDFGVTTPGTVTAVIANVPAGASGTVTFQFEVGATTAAGTIFNQAQVSYGDGSGTTVTGSTNQVPFDVLVAAAVDIVGEAKTDPVPQGSTVTFTNVVTNHGNQTDTFDITLSNSTYPAGTTFLLFKSDGQTPLLDTNSTGIPDTGPLAPGASYNVVLKVILPSGASGVGPYSVDKTARSANDNTVFDTAQDSVPGIAPSTVDLTNNVSIANGATPAHGLGAGPEANPITTVAVNPGAVANFTLYVNNTSAQADAYVLEASSNSTFAPLTLPAGWSVQYFDSNGTAITDTGLIPAGGDKLVTARVTVPANAPAGDFEIYFRATSPTTGVSDIKHDRVTVNTVRNLSITPNNTGQVYPGGSIVYSHTITNNGNVVEGDGVNSTTTLALTNTLGGFTAVIYWDRDNDGVLGPNDPVIDDLSDLVGGSGGASTAAGLDVGESATLFVKVYAPPGAVAGSTNVTDITATTTQGTYPVAAPAPAVASDTTTIISGDLKIDKAQALDADGDFVLDGPYSTNVQNALPGARVRYRITVTNTGTADAQNVVLNDVTPSFTVYDVGDGTTTATGVAVMTLDNGGTFTAITAPTPGTAGAVTANIGTLTPGQSAVIYFGVRIQQ